MSTTSYIRNRYTLRWVYYSYHNGKDVVSGKSLRYAQTDEGAEQEAREHLLIAGYPSFMIWKVETEHH